MQNQSQLDGRPAETTSFPRGQCCTRCYAAKSEVKKCRCRCKGEHHGNVYARSRKEE